MGLVPKAIGPTWGEMKVVTATSKTQGARPDDFSFTIEGELVTWGPECDDEAIDGACGCKRSMYGVDSLNKTTTFEVTDDPAMTVEILAAKISDFLVAGGWFKSEADGLPLAREYAGLTRGLTCMFDAGSILERRGKRFSMRQAPRVC